MSPVLLGGRLGEIWPEPMFSGSKLGGGEDSCAARAGAGEGWTWFGQRPEGSPADPRPSRERDRDRDRDRERWEGHGEDRRAEGTGKFPTSERTKAGTTRALRLGCPGHNLTGQGRG